MYRRTGAKAPNLLSRRAVAGLALLALLAGCGTTPSPAPPLDLLIVGGTVHDGTGAEGRRADVGVAGDRIAFVGDASGLAARRTIDATGLVVAPGFIDPHTHSGGDLSAGDPGRRAVLNHLTQGVTTVFVGNDGGGDPDIDGTLSAEGKGIGVNLASFVGFGAVRAQVVGQGARPPTPQELDEMKALVAQAMCQGALGFSAGLYYAPQSYATTDEVVALAHEGAIRGGVYETHLRDESSDNIGLIAAVNEALEIGRRAGMPVHLAHIKAQGVDVHGKSGEVIALVEAERAAGHRVTADQYPWRASGTHISNALIPRWAMDGGDEATKKRLADPSLRGRLEPQIADNIRRRGGPESLLLTSGPHLGRTLGQVAAQWNVSPVEAAVRIVRDEDDAAVASFNMDEADIRNFAAQPWVVTSSDATNGHPRKFGTFPMRWAKFVRDNPVMTPAQFVRRSSGLTADIFGIEQRGYLREGYFADVIAFDPAALKANADFEHPRELSTGVVLALVNGVAAIDDGRPTRALAGKGLRRPITSQGDCPQ